MDVVADYALRIKTESLSRSLSENEQKTKTWFDKTWKMCSEGGEDKLFGFEDCCEGFQSFQKVVSGF